MKKIWLLTTLLIGSLIFTGCDTTILDWDKCKDWACNEVNNEVMEEVNNEISNETTIEKKTSLALEDFDYINQNLMPKSYHYEITNNVTNELISEWDYEYSEDAHTVLEPPHVVNKEITNSELYEDVIYMTTIKYTAEDWQNMNVTYYNNADNLKYISALYIEWQRSTNYEFNY